MTWHQIITSLITPVMQPLLNQKFVQDGINHFQEMYPNINVNDIKESTPHVILFFEKSYNVYNQTSIKEMLSPLTDLFAEQIAYIPEYIEQAPMPIKASLATIAVGTMGLWLYSKSKQIQPQSNHIVEFERLPIHPMIRAYCELYEKDLAKNYFDTQDKKLKMQTADHILDKLGLTNWTWEGASHQQLISVFQDLKMEDFEKMAKERQSMKQFK